MNFRKVTLPAATALFLLTGGVGKAAILLNDNFDAENGGVGQLNYFNFANFVVSNAGSGGAVDLIGIGTIYDFYPGNGLYVDICGSLSVCGVLTTKQMFAPGNYTIILELGGNARENVVDSTGITFGTFSLNIPLGENEVTTLTESITLTAPAALSISDEGLLAPLIGNVLLSVEVANDVFAIPEPASLAILGAGLLALAGFLRRRAW